MPKVVVWAAGERAAGVASNKGSTSMLILCKCVEIRCTGIQSVISEKQTLRGLYTQHGNSLLAQSPLRLSLTLTPTLSLCEMRFSDIRVYIIYKYICVYHPNTRFPVKLYQIYTTGSKTTIYKYICVCVCVCVCIDHIILCIRRD